MASKGLAMMAMKGWSTMAAKGVMSQLFGGKDGGKGKDGKGKKGKKVSKEGGKGHLLERNRISAEKFLGTVAAWKGKYGWITPSEEIPHEKASLHRGSLFTCVEDLVGLEALTDGATVEFH